MRTTRLFLLTLLLSSVSLVATVLAQGYDEPDVGQVSVDDFGGGYSLGNSGTYLMFRRDTGSGVGYNDGFQTFGLFSPWFSTDEHLVFGNARMLLTDQSQVGANLGVGYRYYMSDLDRVFGVTAWYDTDETNNGFRYDQLTVSLQTLGKNFDVRGNAYLPTGNDTNFAFPGVILPTPSFLGNQIVFPGTAYFEEAMKGGDIEVGVPLPGADWIRTYAGVYAYDATNRDDPIGVRGRLEAWVSNVLTVQMGITNDRIYGTNVTLGVDVRFPGNIPAQFLPNLTPRQRMLLPDERNYRIAAQTYLENFDVAAINPATGNPYNVVHIDNSAGSNPGTGTFEDPFFTIPDSAPGADLILVREGNSTLLRPYIGGITLFDDQRFLGEGKAHQFDATAELYGASLAGTFGLPGFTNTGMFPFVRNPTGNVVTLADNNEVSAFNFVNSLGNGVFGNSITDFNINCINVFNSGGGVRVRNGSGTGIVANSNFYSNTNGGVIIDTGSSLLNLSLNEIVSNGGNFGVSLTADNGNMNAVLDNVSGTNNETGLQLAGTLGRTLNATITDNNYRSNNSNGISVIANNAGRVLFNATDTHARRNGGNGLRIETMNGGRVVGSLTRGNLSMNDRSAVRIIADDSVNNSLALTNVLGNSSGMDGMEVDLTTNSRFDVSIVDSAFINSGDDGIDTDVASGSTLNLFVDPTPVTNSVGNGFNFNVASGGTLNAEFIQSNFNNSGLNAVLGVVDDGTANLIFDDTPGTFAGENGFFVTATNGALINGSVNNGDFSNAGQNAGLANAVRVIADDSVVNLDFFGTPGTNATSDGLFVQSTANATFNGTFADGDFSQSGVFNAGNAVNLIADGGNINLVMDNTAGASNGANGLLFDVSNAGTMDARFTDGDFSFNPVNAVQGTVDGPGSVAFLGMNNTLGTDSGGDGLFVTTTNEGQFVGVITDGSFANSGVNAIHLDVSTDSQAALVLNDTPGNNAMTANGFLLDVASGGRFDGTVTGGDFSSAAINAFQLNVTGTNSLANLVVTGTDGTFAGADAVAFNVDDSGFLDAVFGLSQFDNAGANGFHGEINSNTIGNANSFANIGITNTTVTFATEDGLLVNAVQGGNFNAALATVDFSNSDANSTGTFNGIELFNDDALMNIGMVDVTSTGAGNNGMLFTVQNTGELIGVVANSNFNDNPNHAIEGLVTGTDSTATWLMDNTTANRSGDNGIDLTVNSAGNLEFIYTNGSVATSGLNGVSVLVDGDDSVATVGFDTTSIINSGLNSAGPADGFVTSVTTGGTLNAAFSNTTINGNRDNGIRATVDGAGTNPSTANFLMVDSFVDLNVNGDGFGFDVTNGGNLLADVTNTSFSNNGISTDANGVRGTVDGTDSLGLLSFSSTTADFNTLSGFDFLVTDAATLAVFIEDGSSASNNNSYGVNFNAMDVGTTGILSMDGSNTFDNNGLVVIPPVAGINFVATDVDLAVVDIAGGVNNSGAEGINIDIDNVTEAVINVTGTGVDTISNNAGTGIDITITDTFVSELFIDNEIISDNAGAGISIVGLNSTIDTGFGTISNNVITDNTAGDGILLSLTDSFADGFAIIDNPEISGNSGDGINLDLLRTPIADLNISRNGGNTVGGVGLTFFIDGDTFSQPFSITNSSTPGIQLTNFSLDISTAQASPSGALFDTDATGSPVPFTPVFGSDVTTGLITVNGTDVVAGTIPLEDTLGNVLVDGGVPDNSQIMVLDFNDFDSSETFAWNIDVDTTVGGAELINGEDLIGSTVIASYDNGSTIPGTLVGTGTAGQSTFIADAGALASGISSNGGVGIRFNLEDSTLTDAIVEDNTISENTLEGILYDLTNSEVSGRIARNNITMNGANGVGFNLNTAPINIDFGSTVDRSVTDNNISGNVGAGFGIALDTGHDLIADFNGNVMNGNGSFGLGIAAEGSATLDVTMNSTVAQTSTYSSNIDAGIGIDLREDVTGSIVINNTTASNNLDNAATLNFVGQGVGIFLRDNVALSQLIIEDNMNSFSGNASHGVHLSMTDDSTIPLVSIQRNNFDDNGANALLVDMRDMTTIGDLLIDENTVSNHTSGDGLGVRFNNVAAITGTFEINDNVMTGNTGGAGINVLGAADTNNTVVIQGNDIQTGQRGIRLTLNNDAVLDATIDSNTLSNNTNDGIRLEMITDTLANPAVNTILTTEITNNVLDSNGSDAIEILFTGGTQSTTLIDGNFSNANQITGLPNNSVPNTGNSFILANIASTTNTLTISNNLMFNSDNRGIDINNSGLTTLDISDNSLGQSTNEVVRVNNLALLTATITDNEIFGASNATNGDGVALINSAVSDFTLLGNEIYDNQGNGIDILHSLGVMDIQIGTTTAGEGNWIHDNTLRGINARYTASSATSFTTTGDLNIVGNLIDGNLSDGVFVDLDPNIAYSDTVLVNPNIPFPNPNTPNVTQPNYSIARNANTFLGVPWASSNRSVSIDMLFNDNEVTSNGATGLVLQVGSNSELTAQVRRNTFGGNTLTDFNTLSRISGPNPSTSVIVNPVFGANPPVPNRPLQSDGLDTVFLDRLARLDLQFLENDGDSMADVTAEGATYTNADPIKGTNRDVFVFRVEEGNPFIPGDALTILDPFTPVTPTANLFGTENVFLQDLQVAPGFPNTPSEIFGAGSYQFVFPGTFFTFP